MTCSISFYFLWHLIEKQNAQDLKMQIRKILTLNQIWPNFRSRTTTMKKTTTSTKKRMLEHTTKTTFSIPYHATFLIDKMELTIDYAGRQKGR